MSRWAGCWAVTAVCAGWLPTAARAETPDLPALLTKLAAHADQVEANERMLDYERTERTEELDRNGSTAHVVERLVRMEHPGGKEHEVLVREVRDGKDITEEKRAAFDEAQARYREKKAKDPNKHDSFRAESPFRTSQQPRYAFRILGSEGKRVRLGVAPKGAAEKDLLRGEAWVDAEAGAVVSAHLTPSQLPRFVDQAWMDLAYGQAEAQKPVLTELKFEGSGGILFMKKHFRGSIAFKDYRAPGK